MLLLSLRERALALDVSEAMGTLPRVLPSVAEGQFIFQSKSSGLLPSEIFREVEMVDGLTGEGCSPGLGWGLPSLSIPCSQLPLLGTRP